MNQLVRGKDGSRMRMHEELFLILQQRHELMDSSEDFHTDNSATLLFST